MHPHFPHKFGGSASYGPKNMVSPGRHGPMGWSQPPLSSHIGTVTRGLTVMSGVEVIPSPWLKARPQLLNISMKLTKSYRYVKWPCLKLFAKLLIIKITLNGPAPCAPFPSSDLWGWGHLYIFNISWISWVLDPVTNPFLVTGSSGGWLHPVTDTATRQEAYKLERKKKNCHYLQMTWYCT